MADIVHQLVSLAVGLSQWNTKDFIMLRRGARCNEIREMVDYLFMSISMKYFDIFD